MALVPKVALAAAALFAVTACGAVSGSLRVTSSTPSPWQSASLQGVPGGFRATTFDSARNSLWIVTRFFIDAGHPQIALTQFNIQDGSVISTAITMPATGFIRGAIALDPQGDVWIAWGHTLVDFHPPTRTMRSWGIPSPKGIPITKQNPALDGNAVSMGVAPDGEVWVASHGVQAVIGLNPRLGMWDQVVPVPMSPSLLSRLAFTPAGTLALSGQGPDAVPALITVDLARKTSSTPTPNVMDFALNGSSFVYLSVDKALRRLDSVGNPASTIVSNAPVAVNADLAVDGTNNAWFSMVANHAVGLGRVSLSSGSIGLFPFPQVEPSAEAASVGCPAPGLPCGSGVFDPQIQSIVIDPRGDVWVTTSVPGPGGDPHYVGAASALYELPAGSY